MIRAARAGGKFRGRGRCEIACAKHRRAGYRESSFCLCKEEHAITFDSLDANPSLRVGCCAGNRGQARSVVWRMKLLHPVRRILMQRGVPWRKQDLK